ncbi:hypothetical protein J7E38_13680 [Bacillus sp. ISL-35]|uniref:hypothetical protein n=1 Tax=Bacillus sp. ISL-35 TaxID=2819122 RepID=UPI001BE7C44C|nr:hypothetical protein [Bacillus sp. ISL-35]MBT2680060.1 hypothetical protein [Bacillus sp. ISL-35]MBT2702963.1 hypothetical protein [Chryseobacterium sp. ISL-80]
MAIYSFRTGTYARNIYLYGNTSFDSIPAEYHEPVKQYAAQNFSVDQIETARNNLWISEIEYTDTMTYKS